MPLVQLLFEGKVTSTGAFSTAQRYWLSNHAGNIAIGPPGVGFITKVGMGIDANNLLVMIEPPVELT